MPYSLILDLFVAVLLVVTIGYAVVLNKRLGRLRGDKAALEKLAALVGALLFDGEDGARARSARALLRRLGCGRAAVSGLAARLVAVGGHAGHATARRRLRSLVTPLEETAAAVPSRGAPVTRHARAWHRASAERAARDERT